MSFFVCINAVLTGLIVEYAESKRSSKIQSSKTVKLFLLPSDRTLFTLRLDYKSSAAVSSISVLPVLTCFQPESFGVVAYFRKYECGEGCAQIRSLIEFFIYPSIILPPSLRISGCSKMVSRKKSNEVCSTSEPFYVLFILLIFVSSIFPDTSQLPLRKSLFSGVKFVQ